MTVDALWTQPAVRQISSMDWGGLVMGRFRKAPGLSSAWAAEGLMGLPIGGGEGRETYYFRGQNI